MPIQEKGDEIVKQAIKMTIAKEYQEAYEILKSTIDQPKSKDWELFAYNNLFATYSFLRGECKTYINLFNGAYCY